MTQHSIAITVTGHAEREFTPNRCTVRLRVHADGATHEDAAQPATAAIKALTDLVTELRERDSSPVKRWTLDQVQHSRHRPYSQDGKTRSWRHQSSAWVTVTFTDFRAVGPFVTRASEVEAVNVDHLRWWVSRKAEAKRVAKVRQLAVLDAIEKAQGFTEALGFGTFHAVAIADPGMLGVAPPTGPIRPAGAPMMRALAAPMGVDGDPELVLDPDRLTISADVEARFEAS